jgi:hypothetical protein
MHDDSWLWRGSAFGRMDIAAGAGPIYIAMRYKSMDGDA